MNLFSSTVGELNDADIAVAQALADVATIGIIQERIVRDSGIVAEQLLRALQSRVLIEQAKGAVAQTGNISPESAFAMMRKFARDNNVTLSGVCEGVMDRTLEITNSGAASTVKLMRK